MLNIPPAKKAFLSELLQEVNANNGKISEKVVTKVAEDMSYEYSKTGDSVRHAVGVIDVLGAKFVGNAMVLDPLNDVASKGNEVARANIKNQLWSYLGGLVKALS